MLIAILGRQPQLSLAELESYFGSDLVTQFNEGVALINTSSANIDHFGGVLKFAKVKDQFDLKSLQKNLKDLEKSCLVHLPSDQGKITLGISWYGDRIPLKLLHNLAMKIRFGLKKRGASVRLLPISQLNISTATAHHNQLGKNPKKIEVIVVNNHKQVIVGYSIGSQNISAYRDRDQKRPKRDSKVGMLPPKLAQIIVNLSRPETASAARNGTLLDPFCGTGVILQEAHLLGFDIIGSDIEPRMIEYSRQNLNWLSDKLTKTELLVGDATNTKWPKFDCVASEAYLGRPFGTPPTRTQIIAEKQLVQPIISGFLKNLRQQISPTGQVCLAIPAWLETHERYADIDLVRPERLSQLGYKIKHFSLVSHQDLLYYRPGQSVARRLLVLQPKGD